MPRGFILRYQEAARQAVAPNRGGQGDPHEHRIVAGTRTITEATREQGDADSKSRSIRVIPR
jgi:hypothetical protein